jgi:hypothetical protein
MTEQKHERVARANRLTLVLFGSPTWARARALWINRQQPKSAGWIGVADQDHLGPIESQWPEGSKEAACVEALAHYT